MKIICDLISSVDSSESCVATIGKFDGMHLGHQALLDEVKLIAKEKQLATMVILFEPHPEEFFLKNNNPPARLMRWRDKVDFLKKQGIDYVVTLRFNQALSSMKATDFVEELLIQKWRVSVLVVGDGFHFGARKEGDFSLLQRYEPLLKPVRIATMLKSGQRISSSNLREALKKGDFLTAKAFLGRSFGLTGRVAHGQKLGRELGFPTANIFLARDSTPLSGVFVVEVHGVAEKPWPGVANLGTRPTVDGQRVLLEVYLFDFDGDLYGRRVTVDFLSKIREEERFESLEELTRWIQSDVAIAKAFFVNKVDVS